MGFFASGGVTNGRREKQTVSIETMHKLQCKICPLDQIRENKNPHIEPSGATNPVVYMLGEAPGRDEDEQGTQFVGSSGQYLRSFIPARWESKLRWNNTIRCRPPGNRDPELIETECCRPYIITDIERSKPKAIFGFGGFALTWATGANGISKWRGRRTPVRIGRHECWFYAMHHPAYVVRLSHSHNEHEREIERLFEMDLLAAFAEIESLPKPHPYTQLEIDAGVEILTGKSGDLRKVVEFLSWAGELDAVGVDFETQGLRPYRTENKLLTAAIGTEMRSLAFPLNHPQAEWSVRDRRGAEEAWINFLRSPAIKVVHNLSFEHEWIGVKFGKEFLRKSRWECTEAQASIIDERIGRPKPGCLSLEHLVQQYFGFNLKSLVKLDKTNMENEPLLDILPYNAKDAKFAYLLWHEQNKVIDKEGLRPVYERAIRRVPAAVLTQMKGVSVDQEQVQTLQKKYGDRIDTLLSQIEDDPAVRKCQKMLSQRFNPQSTKHLMLLLTDVLGKRSIKSVEAEVLREIGHPVTDAIISLRQAVKRKSTYIDPLSPDSEESVIYPDGLIHHKLNVDLVETGRSSADSPNVQNWIKRDQEGREVRKQIAAPPGYLICAFDYKQMQVCNLAMESRDDNLVHKLRHKEDLHMDWTVSFSKLYPNRLKRHAGEKEVLKAFRTDVKNQWTFPLFFGCTAEAAANYLDIPVDIVRPQYDKFWSTYPGVKRMQQRFINQYHEKGYVAGLSGRRRHAPMSKNEIINSPIQADEAELVFDAFCRLSELEEPKYQPNMEIHDDLTFFLPKKTLERDAEVILNEMLFFDAFPWVNVPIGVELSVGQNWHDLESVETFYSDDWERKKLDQCI